MAANRDQYLDPYRAAVERYGGVFDATLWRSRPAQLLRFDVAIALAAPAGTIVDIGCGVGDLAAHMLEQGIEFDEYVGIDAMPEMIETARARALPRTRFETADAVRDIGIVQSARPDLVMISGTLNTMDDATARSLITGCWESASAGVVFNFLSDRCPPEMAEHDLHPARRFDTLAWIDWALGLTDRVAFRQDYLAGHDATLFIGRPLDADGEAADEA